MEKKFRLSDRPLITKIIYGSVLAILCISAVVVGIVAVNSRKAKTPEPEENPGQTEPEKPTPTPKPDDKGSTKGEDTRVSFICPVKGTVAKNHSMTLPVFSDTLGEWRVHTGIDIATEEGAFVTASAPGTVSRIYTDRSLGQTVEITHKGGFVTRYSNLNADKLNVAEGETVAAGKIIGYVGDTANDEIADEAHLHFEILANGVKVNPIDYFTDEDRKNSLGIETVDKK